MAMDISFGNAPFCLSSTFVISLNSCPLWLEIVLGLLWHGWLRGLSTPGERDPWAASLGQFAGSGFWTLRILGTQRTWLLR